MLSRSSQCLLRHPRIHAAHHPHIPHLPPYPPPPPPTLAHLPPPLLTRSASRRTPSTSVPVTPAPGTSVLPFPLSDRNAPLRKPFLAWLRTLPREICASSSSSVFVRALLELMHAHQVPLALRAFNWMRTHPHHIVFGPSALRALAQGVAEARPNGLPDQKLHLDRLASSIHSTTRALIISWSPDAPLPRALTDAYEWLMLYDLPSAPGLYAEQVRLSLPRTPRTYTRLLQCLLSPFPSSPAREPEDIFADVADALERMVEDGLSPNAKMLGVLERGAGALGRAKGGLVEALCRARAGYPKRDDRAIVIHAYADALIHEWGARVSPPPARKHWPASFPPRRMAHTYDPPPEPLERLMAELASHTYLPNTSSLPPHSAARHLNAEAHRLHLLIVYALTPPPTPAYLRIASLHFYSLLDLHRTYHSPARLHLPPTRVPPRVSAQILSSLRTRLLASLTLLIDASLRTTPPQLDRALSLLSSALLNPPPPLFNARQARALAHLLQRLLDAVLRTQRWSSPAGLQRLLVLLRHTLSSSAASLPERYVRQHAFQPILHDPRRRVEALFVALRRGEEPAMALELVLATLADFGEPLPARRVVWEVEEARVEDAEGVRALVEEWAKGEWKERDLALGNDRGMSVPDLYVHPFLRPSDTERIPRWLAPLNVQPDPPPAPPASDAPAPDPASPSAPSLLEIAPSSSVFADLPREVPPLGTPTCRRPEAWSELDPGLDEDVDGYSGTLAMDGKS